MGIELIDSRVRFRHLRTFIEVVRQNSVGRAAQVLAVSQPAVTKTIRELEEILDKKLFEKDGRGLKVTRYGEVFLRHAGASVAALQTGIDSLSRVDAGPPVRIGALPTVSARIMPGVMERFLAEGTDSPVKIVTGENQVLLGQLRTGTLDLVVGRLAAPEQMAGLTFEYLYSEQVRFVVRAGHPLLAGNQFDFERIRDYTILMPPIGSVIRPYVDRYLLAHGLAELPHAIETVSDSFGHVFVSQTDAIWVISEGVVIREMTAGRLAALPVDTTETQGAVGLTTREDSPSNASLEILTHTIRDVIRERAG
ncbi:pca operon transcription factor PcaQ [Pelagibacterium halotolerans]|uniref:Pca operon transcriptional activator PcaQ n=1 Tax=Pelagibacterium halotolerans (strain DSM 22347 / JCM 15775 / CGMCC 1.7692 / B2) TaxID=1082931 RepID=G4RCS8_PELHB|nr:Pca operon transcriptional activator PcaQ [Pelagibacterium halotolerans B2]SEA21709.1 LysR family transcriptional regulator, pca operon transcriptional activator [Pelagibacterium halotolerans]